MPEAGGDLRRARSAFEDRAWALADEAFAKADAYLPLAAADLEKWATAAYLLGRDNDFTALLDRAHQRHLDHGDTERAAYCACWLGLSLNGIGAHAQASGWFARARRLLKGSRVDTVVHGYLKFADALAAVAGGDVDTAFQLGQRVVSLAAIHRDADLSALSLQLLGRIQLRRSLMAEGYALLDEAMITVSSGALRPEVAGIVYCSVIDGCRAGYSLLRAHEWTLALTRMCKEQPELVAFSGECHVSKAEMHVLHGAWQDALAEAEQALEHLAPWSARKITAAAHYQRAEVYRLKGDFEAAAQEYEAGGREGGRRQPGLALLHLVRGEVLTAAGGIARVLEETTDPLLRARFLPATVTIALAAKEPDLEVAREAAAELAAVAVLHETTALVTMSRHAMGEVELASGNALEASSHLRAAIDGWLELSAPYEVARARVLLASAYRMLEDAAGADLEFAAAEQAFTALGAEPDVAGLAAVRSPATTVSALSRRELEVLKLLVAGETNRNIGATLAISERTVDRHVSNIFDKLAVSSRTQAATYAVRHELF